MNPKLFFPLLVAGLLGGLFLYLYFNPSYEKAAQARWHYFLGHYEKAEDLAREAYALDRYNRMAFTVLTQSKVAMKYVQYIEQAKHYMQRIDAIAEKRSVSAADKARIKMMCKVVIGGYRKLAATRLTDDALIREAKRQHERFTQLYDELFGAFDGS